MQEKDFDRVADIYDQTIPPHIVTHYLNKRINFIRRYGPSGLALDIGSGTGLLDSQLIKTGLKLVSLDISQGMLLEAKKRGHFLLVCGDSLFLPFKNDSFKLVISIATLHHLVDKEKISAAIREMIRITKPGGKIIIWDHNFLNPYWYFFMRRLPQDRGRTRLVPLKEIVNNLKDSNIESIETYKMGFVPDFLPKFLLGPWQILEKFIEYLPLLNIFCAHNVICASKKDFPKLVHLKNKSASNKVILIRPSRLVTDAAFLSLQYPLNLGYLAGYLISKDFDVEIWDYEVENLTRNGLFERLAKDIPLVIGMTAMTPTVKNAYRLAKMIKESFPEIPIVIGGPHVSFLPKETLEEFPSFDVVVMGEGEETMLQVCFHLKAKEGLDGIGGIAYRKETGIIVENARPPVINLDALPFPRRDLVDYSLYQSHHASRGFSRDFLRISELITSRGCSGRCIFCTCHNRPTRFRSIENVKAEMEECIKKYNTNHFSFLDDTLTLSSKYISELCKVLKRFKNISWDCFARVDTVSFDILKDMAASGCQKVSYGIESGSSRILNLIKKDVSLGQVKEVFNWSRKAGIKYIEGSFMLGCYPTETKEEVGMTWKLIEEVKPDILMLSIMIPYPGTEIYEIMKEGGYLEEPLDWDSFAFFSKKLAWRTEYFSSDELVAVYKGYLRRFYLNPFYIFRVLRKIRNFDELKYWLNSGLSFIKKI